jgi:hypothetical protein
MKALLIKMASIANELDLNGFEKEANQVTESMARMAQPNLMKQRMEPGQYKISQPALKEIQDFVATHQLDVPDAYAWVLGKYGRGQANEWRASIEGNAATQAPSAAAQPNPSAVANPTSGLNLEPIKPITQVANTNSSKISLAQTAPAYDLKTLIQLAQTLQNSLLAPSVAQFNSQYETSLKSEGVKALGELAREYNELARVVDGTCKQTKQLFDSNQTLLSKLPPVTKITVVENIFQPIRKLINRAQTIRIKEINPNLSGLFALDSGGNLDRGDAYFKASTDEINKIVAEISGATPSAPAAAPTAPGASPQQAQV